MLYCTYQTLYIMKKWHILALALLVLTNIAFNQTLEERKELFEDGNFFYDSEDYSEAIYYFKKLYDYDNTNGNICYYVGLCYLHIPGQETLAIPYLEKAVAKISYNYTKSTFGEGRAPLHAMFYLGNAYRINNQLQEALEIYDRFLNSPYFEGNYNLEIVTTEIEACKQAKVIQDKPIPIKRENLGEIINDNNNNSHPLISGNDSVLIFMSSLKFYDAIFMAVRTDTGWSWPINITPQVASDGDCYPTGLSYDGKELFLVRKEKKKYDIFMSKWEGDKWSVKQELGKNINSGGKETHASPSADGKYLYFTSTRGGRGGLDIFVSERQSNGEWGKATNLGKVINTSKDEETPFVSDDGKVLFFASNGHASMGGFDIFYSKNVNGKWTPSVNIGFPINTTNDNLFYNPLGKGLISYQALILDEGYGQKDIYRIKITGGDNYKDIHLRE